MSMNEGQRLGQRAAKTRAAAASRPEDRMERVHRAFDQRNLRHAVELILASPDAKELVEELSWRLAQRGRTTA